jgi:probable rRNA maturation factor
MVSAKAVGSLEVDIDVIVETDHPPQIEAAELAELVRFALERSGAAGRWSIALVLTWDRRLRELHRDFMGIDEETDVMTFPAVDDATGAVTGGDIVISVERAAEQAAEEGHGTVDEIRFLAVHGLLHLVGWDDATADERARMHARQAIILEEFGRRA